MWKQLVDSFKVEINLKDIAIWFVLSLLGVLIVFGFIGNKAFNMELCITSVGFALVFVVLMAMTKSYSHFLDVYYGNTLKKHEARTNRK